MNRYLETALLVLAMLVLGSYNTIASKLMYQTSCPALPSGRRLFNKPWLTNLFMFCGEASLLLIFYFRNHVQQKNDLTRDLIADDSKAPSRGNDAPLYIFLLPACLDVLGTGIGAVALMFINAAVWQMMRGSIIIFSAILAVVYLKRRLHAYHWVGVTLTVLGLLLIGLTAVLEEPPAVPADGRGTEGGTAIFGILLVVLAQVFASFQVTFEEHLLTGYQVSSMLTVGMEGIWGCVVMITILACMTVIPGHDHGVYESFPEGMHMIIGSGMLQSLVTSYMLCIAFYNFVGMQLCRKLSAVTRCLVDCMRTAVVWAFQLLLHYGVSTKYGTAWTRYSILQVIGFLLLVLGTFVYNGLAKLPGFNYKRRSSELPRRFIQATWSPTVNRATNWGRGPSYGPQSPGGFPNSPLPAPFGVEPQSPDASPFNSPVVDTPGGASESSGPPAFYLTADATQEQQSDACITMEVQDGGGLRVQNLSKVQEA